MSTPASAVFTLRFDAPTSDVDGLGHVSNIAYVRWIQDAAVAHSNAVGLDFEAYRRLGAVFVVRRHEIDYLAPVLGGESLIVRTHVQSFRGASSERHTVMVGPAGREVTRALTTWAYVSLENGRPMRIPDEVLAAFAKPLPG